jgi:Fur family ferric uptake transcriptional regulator
MRLTRQRKAMIDTLAEMDTHPTADEFFTVIRKRLPSISLGSVYRNLEVLADAGHILKLDVGGSAKRFDGRTAPHAHVRCPDCGGVRDLWLADIDKIQRKLDRLVAANQVFDSYRLEFSGRCGQCMPTAAATVQDNP